MSTITSTRLDPTRQRSWSRRATVLAAAGPACLWYALLGPDWLYVPAVPGKSPAAGVNFAALSAITAHSDDPLQRAYFGWLAWVLAGIATVVVVLALRSRWTAAVCVAVGIGALVLTVLATKGDLTWSAFFDQAGNTRLGQALGLAGPCALVVLGTLRLISADTVPKHRSDT